MLVIAIFIVWTAIINAEKVILYKANLYWIALFINDHFSA